MHPEVMPESRARQPSQDAPDLKQMPTHRGWHPVAGEDLKYAKTKGERRPSNSPMQGMIADYFKARRGVCRALLNLCCVHDCPVSLGP